MIIVLLTVFAVAVVIIVAGLLLSVKPPDASLTLDRGMSYAGRDKSYTGGMYTGKHRARRVGEERRMYVRRAPVEIERRAWSGIVRSLNVARLFNWRPGTEAPWLGIILTVCVLFLLVLYLMRSMLPNSAALIDSTWVGTVDFKTNVAIGTPAAGPATQPFSGMIGASKDLKRVNQLDPAQYASTQEFDQWAYSACSAAAMTEVINSYGHQFRITDILKVEANLGAISSDLGLLEPTGIDRTVAKFGFQTTWLQKPSVTDLINVANQGRPVIINFPPYRWSGGHLLVVTGGTKDYVYLADSSSYNMHAMTHTVFLKYWVGFAVVVTPK